MSTKSIYPFINKLCDQLGSEKASVILGVTGVTFYFISYQSIKYFHLTTEESIWGRGLMMLLAFYVLCLKNNQKFELVGNKSQQNKVIFRNVVLNLQQLVMITCLHHLPLPLVGVISNTGPIFTVLITSILTGTHIKVSDRWYILLSFIGVTIISGSDYILGIIFEIKKEDNQEPVSFIYAIIFLLSNVVWAWCQYFTKNHMKVTMTIVNFYYGFILMLTGQLLTLTHALPISFHSLFLSFFSNGVPLSVAMFFLYEGFFLASDAGKYTMIQYIFVIYSYLFGFLVQGKGISFVELGGSAIVFFSLYKIFIPRS